MSLTSLEGGNMIYIGDKPIADVSRTNVETEYVSEFGARVVSKICGKGITKRVDDLVRDGHIDSTTFAYHADVANKGALSSWSYFANTLQANAPIETKVKEGQPAWSSWIHYWTGSLDASDIQKHKFICDYLYRFRFWSVDKEVSGYGYHNYSYHYECQFRVRPSEDRYNNGWKFLILKYHDAEVSGDVDYVVSTGSGHPDLVIPAQSNIRVGCLFLYTDTQG